MLNLSLLAEKNNGLGIKEGGECLVGSFKKAVSLLDAYKPKDTQFAPLYFIPCYQQCFV